MIGIIDYDSGNINAIQNIYKNINVDTIPVRKPADLCKADRLILPGVGAFDEAMTKLNESGLRSALDEAVLKNRIPILGICIGMQIMADDSEEGNLKGLGWIEGSVKKFEEKKINFRPKLPHMGWNKVKSNHHPIFENVNEENGFYFLHSYFFSAASRTDVLAHSYYYEKFCCAVGRNNILGFQFHPEKSHSNGVKLFQNFVEIF